MFKKLIVLTLVSLAAFRAIAAEEKNSCATAMDIYATVLKEYAKKTEASEIMKLVQKRNAVATELEISQIIFHVSQMLNAGWSSERILGYVEGVCVTVPTMEPVRREIKTEST